MLATCSIAGRVLDEPVFEKDENGNQLCWMNVETEKPFRNPDGTTSTFIFRVRIWRGIAEECAARCREGVLVAIHGRLESEPDGDSYRTVIQGEKVSYASDLSAA